jgi:holo-[acyl-carrier protein] synthase
MKLATGIDLIEIARIEEVVSRHGRHYLERVFTPAELDYCGKRAESLAGRFAAKEAVAKALGTGIGDVAWQDIEILGDEQKAPTLTLQGKAERRARELGLTSWSISISHDQSYAIAFVVAIG